MFYDYSELTGLIIAKFRTQSAFAAAMHMSERSLSLKLNNRVPFTQPEIDKAVDLLSIKPTQVGRYFFAKNVQ